MSIAKIVLSEPLLRENCDRINRTTGLHTIGATFYLVEDADGKLFAITELRDGEVITNDDWRSSHTSDDAIIDTASATAANALARNPGPGRVPQICGAAHMRCRCSFGCAVEVGSVGLEAMKIIAAAEDLDYLFRWDRHAAASLILDGAE